MSKSNFVTYTLFILLIGLGMVWRANQVESNLKAQIILLEKSRSEWARVF